MSLWKKAGEALGDLVSGGTGGLMDVVEKGIDAFTTDEERMEKENERRRSEFNYKLEMRKTDIDEQQIYLEDTQSARENQSRIQESENASWLAKNVPPLLSLAIPALTFFMFYLALFGEMKVDNTTVPIIMFVLGHLASDNTQVISAIFGSSKDRSKSKNIPLPKEG